VVGCFFVVVGVVCVGVWFGSVVACCGCLDGLCWFCVMVSCLWVGVLVGGVGLFKVVWVGGVGGVVGGVWFCCWGLCFGGLRCFGEVGGGLFGMWWCWGVFGVGFSVAVGSCVGCGCRGGFGDCEVLGGCGVLVDGGFRRGLLAGVWVAGCWCGLECGGWLRWCFVGCRWDVVCVR